MKLLAAFLNIGNELTPMFSQERTARRATRLLLSNLLCIGRHWLTRIFRLPYLPEVNLTPL